MTAAFHLNNRGAKRELNVTATVMSKPFLFWGKIGKIVHVLSPSNGIEPKTILVRHIAEASCRLRIECLCQNTALSGQTLVYLTAEYCAPVWYHSVCTQLIDSVLNDALRIVTECLYPTPTDHLPILSGIRPTELRRLGATLFLLYYESLEPDLILYSLLSESSDACQERLRSRRQFLPAVPNLLNNLVGPGIHAFARTNYRWNTKYCESTSKFRAFISIARARPIGMSLFRTAWVQPNHLRSVVE